MKGKTLGSESDGQNKQGHNVSRSHNGDSVPTKPCPHCAGTGMATAFVPEIHPGCCCADYANAVCPVCKGTGIVKNEESAS